MEVRVATGSSLSVSRSASQNDASGQSSDPERAAGGLQNLLCAYLAIAVLVGLLANALFGIWWLDPIIALGIAAVAVREGQKAWRGEGCDCATC